MKYSLILCFLMLSFFSSTKSFSQDTLAFYYDGSGNRTDRVILLGGGKGSGISGKENSISDKEKSTTSDIKKESIPDQIGKFEIKIYPNPIESKITVDILGLEEGENPQIDVYDQLGRLRKSVVNITSTNSLYLSDFPNGVYFLVIRLKSGMKRWTIIKK